MTDKKQFTIGQVISAGTGTLCCDIGEVYEILNFLTGDNLMTHQLPRALRACKQHVIQQFPWMKWVEDNKEACTPETWESFLASAAKEYGQTHELEPLPNGEWEYRNPIEEAEELMGDESKVIPVVVENATPSPLSRIEEERCSHTQS